MTIEQIFKEMVDRGASDVHLRVGVPPALRINGDLYRLQSDRVSPEMMEGFLTVIMNRCPKIEYGRLSGEIGWQGINSRILSSKKPVLAGKGFQKLTIHRPGT